MFSQRMDTLGCAVGFAVRADLAEADLGIEHVVESGLAREIPDGVGQRHVVHDDEWDHGARLGGAAGFGGGGGLGGRRVAGSRGGLGGIVGGDLRWRRAREPATAGEAASLAGAALAAAASPAGEVVWARPARLQATIPTSVRERSIVFHVYKMELTFTGR